MIAQNYNRLHELCNVSDHGNYGSFTKEDIFSETILYVIHDPEALSCAGIEAFCKHFKRRYKLIEFQTIKDSKQLKEIPYADYIQAKKEISKE